MIKIVLVPGHTPRSPGATNTSLPTTFGAVGATQVEIEHDNGDVSIELGTTEYHLANKLAEDVSFILNATYGIEALIVQRGTYQELPNDINRLAPDLVISLHFNAYNTRARGSETLYYHKSVLGKQFAQVLQKEFVQQLGLPDRGIKPKSSEERGGYLLRYVHAPCLIGEPCFMDNDEDLQHVLDNWPKLVQAYATAILKMASALPQGE